MRVINQQRLKVSHRAVVCAASALARAVVNDNESVPSPPSILSAATVAVALTGTAASLIVSLPAPPETLISLPVAARTLVCHHLIHQ